MHVVVPYEAGSPKTRLEPLLDAGERSRLARAMLDDVLSAVEAADGSPHVLATAPLELECPVTVDDSPLSKAVNTVLAERSGEPTAIVMADLALATAPALERLFRTAGPVVLAPGRGGGTNAMVVREPTFRVDFHGCSYRDHLQGLSTGEPTTLDSYRLGTDIDEPADLPEVFIHSDGATRETLESIGFSLAVGEGRVTLERGDSQVIP
ncbi:MAG: 2-phospho-L-lactate guanylyltransferase [Natrialbaceae archaeon]|nr:2-phospho-L-lactate guanylyltransferase [Natrialbaceae archaeon]